VTILLARADARALPLADGSVQTCITSPPYWNLRAYETGSSKHLELGSESTPGEYVQHMIDVFREIRRVLRDDGTVWLTLGDNYATSPPGNKPNTTALSSGLPNSIANQEMRRAAQAPPRDYDSAGLKQKDLIGIPWRVALALQADDWYLRAEIIWAKSLSFCPSYSGSCMPDSTTDRPTRSHEHLFLLTKKPRYFYDQEAIREPCVMKPQRRHSRRPPDETPRGGEQPQQTWSTTVERDEPEIDGNPAGRNLRSVWTINPTSYKGAHYATFPEKLVEPCLLAGTSAKGACASCGSPWERLIETDSPSKEFADDDDRGWANTHQKTSNPQSSKSLHRDEGGVYSTAKVLGWQRTCKCETEEVRPCVVLDPFCGTATVAQVAIQHKRRAVCFDLSAEYLQDLATKRTHNVQVELF